MQDLKLIHVRQQADEIGVKWHHKHKIETIQKNINSFLESSNPTLETVLEMPSKEQPVRPRTPQEERWLATQIIPVTEANYKAEQRRLDKRKCAQLVHCKIHCNNPDKRNWNGEFISVGSAKLGTFKKYVPFDGKPYHLPKIIYDMLVEKKCTIMQKGTDDRGVKATIPSQIKEFNIEVLEPLTLEELDDLRVQQALAKGKVA
jgi:hypothetical protein